MHHNWNALALMSTEPTMSPMQNKGEFDWSSQPARPNYIKPLPKFDKSELQQIPLPTQMETPMQTPIQIPMPPQESGVVHGQEIYTIPQNLPGALKLIEEAVSGENEDRLFYQYLINVAPTEEDKEIIRGIRENEITHFGLFRQIYSQLTGRMLPVPEDVSLDEPSSYCEGLSRALIGEQNAVIEYRKILFALQNRVHINMLTEIITDEIRHGVLYNYLLNKNDCK